MTVSSTTTRVRYEGSGTTGPFTFPYRILSSADLLVTKLDADEIETTLSIGSHYTVSGVGNTTGSITLVDALESGEVLVIRRAPALTQPASFQNQSSYFGKSHEDEYDRLAMQIQSLKDQLDRAFGVPETVTPGSLTLQVRPEVGKAIGWTSDGVLGNLNIDDSGGYSLPAGGRTVATLTAYLANNALFNVVDFGADSTGVADSAAAFRLALAAADGRFGAIFVPKGTFRLDSTIEIYGWQSVIGVGNGSVIKVNHFGDGFLVDPAAGAAGPGVGLQVIAGLRFVNNIVTPAAFIAVDSEATSGSSNLLIERCFFGDTTVTTCIENRTGYNTRIRDCVFTFVHATQCVWFRQSTNDDPYWSYQPTVEGCDFTGNYGHGIRFDGAQGTVSRCVIESQAGEGIWICSSADADGRRNTISIENTYFEGNVGKAIKSSRSLSTGNSSRVRIANCMFFDSVSNLSYLQFDGDTVWIESCTGNPGNRIIGTGIVRLRNCFSMFVERPAASVDLEINVLDRVGQLPALLHEDFQKTINVNGSTGGGAALILCTSSTGGANVTVAELFLVRYGFSGNNYTATSVIRQGGAATVFTFAVDAEGWLDVTSDVGEAKYQVIGKMSKFGEDEY